MGNVIDLPPQQRDCSRCGATLRPASRAELRADLLDPRYRHLAEHAGQGDRDWDPPAHWPEWQQAETPTAPWVLRCDSCGARVVWLGMSEA
jgi:hypothetical protein